MAHPQDELVLLPLGGAGEIGMNFNAYGFGPPDARKWIVVDCGVLFGRETDTPGVDAIDFVIFPPRWLAAEDTFRPPWYHRNVASEFMGLIQGVYDAKEEGFVPGGASLHNCMTGHGPDAATFEKASHSDTSRPHKVGDTMAFMFETKTVIHPSRAALESPTLQSDYLECWQGLKKHFDPTRR